ncbi:MAG: PepSY domain-containing protein [Pyrinomonadaceae bacterium]|nr:PepSY domain-containing protein [Pyrinomonadaceae bacterium]
MKKIFILFTLLLAVAFLSNNAFAQKKQRIGLAEGADSVQVKGKISGKQYALYEIWVEKGDVWEVKLNSTNNFIGYTVKGANGDRYDFLEAAPASGYYTIRVELNSAGAKSKKIADFTLDIKFEMEKNAPVSE